MDKPKIPEHLIIKITNNKQIADAAMIEAAMTYLKKQNNRPNADLVYSFSEVVKSKDEIFLYGMMFGKFLFEFENGLREIPAEIKQVFFQNQGKNN